MLYVPLTNSTWRAIAVLCCAIVCGMAWNTWGEGNWRWSSTKNSSRDDPRIRRFLSRVCQETDVFCHPSLVSKRRTQTAKRHIAQGERILEIPRSMQIWDLDALRNDFMRETFWGATHTQTGNPVDTAAYLAVYLALLRTQQISLPDNLLKENVDSDNNKNNNKDSGEEDLQKKDEAVVQEVSQPRLLQYLQECMPTVEDLGSFHPLFWNDTTLKNLLPPLSATYAVVRAYREMIRSEYQALKNIAKHRTDITISDEWEDNSDIFLSEEDYRTARILVLSRSFGAGPLPVHKASSPPSNSAKDSSVSEDEVEFYKSDIGVFAYAMVPILDFYDHHARPNVDYSYNSERGVFAIRAIGSGIATGHEVVDSYGKFSDSHLFAKFGFVNGDGSGYSQASLATNHPVFDLGLKKQFSNLPMQRNQQQQPLPDSIKKALDRQRLNMKHYVRFDDGYEECILRNTNNHPKEAYELKRLKLQHLAKIANHVKRWHLVLPPRDPGSLPARASNIAITSTPPKMTKETARSIFQRKDYQLIAATCRLISLTHEDYDGNAVALLKKNLNDNTFLLKAPAKGEFPRDSQFMSLEFRTHVCLGRLSIEAMKRFNVSLSDLEDKVAMLNRQSYQSNEWAAAHLQLSELQTLDILRKVSLTSAQQYADLRNKSPAFFIREKPCPESGKE